MKIDKVIVGDLETNCYILKQNNKCIVIDPGDEIDKIKRCIGDNIVVGVIVTHYHFDHIGALNYFNKDIIYDINNLVEGINKIDEFTFEIIYTKGHKEDLISIYFKEEKVMFVGDFIFRNGIGRTDLPGGNIKEMINSLNKIKNYDKDIILYPGHGDYTTIKEEFYS